MRIISSRIISAPLLSRRTTALATACLALLAAGCAELPAGRVPVQAQVRAGLDSGSFARIDSAVNAAIGERRLPGAVFRLERGGDAWEQAYGRTSYEPGAAAVTPDTVYDAASLSKVLATAPAVLLLAEEGKLDLDAKLVDYFPACAGGGKEAITIRQLLNHTSGLAAGLPAKPDWSGDDAAHALACAQAVTHPPGTFFRYSDINYILLGQLVSKAAGQPLDVFVQQRIFAPLGMRDTGYLPLRRYARDAIAPTRKPGEAGGALLQGVVHDPTVRRIGGVAGSAGVFTTARDVARFARMLLGQGELEGVRVLRPESVRLLTTVQSPPGIAALRGLGMDIDSPYAQRPRGALYPVGSYGHTGFTGCILWIDPGSRSFYVFLSNRVYPDDKANVLPLYTQLGTLAAESAQVGAAPVRKDAAAP